MTKEQLSTALDIKRKLSRFEDRLSDLRAAGGVRTSLQAAGGRGGGNGNAAELAGELAEEIAGLRKDLEIEQKIIRRELEKLELDGLEKQLMRLRYVDCREWTEVAAKMAYSKITVLKKHADIIKRMKRMEERAGGDEVTG